MLKNNWQKCDMVKTSKSYSCTSCGVITSKWAGSQIGLPKDKSLGLEIAKAVIEQNIDDPEDNLAILNALGKDGSYTTRSYPLIAALCSERILKI